MRKLGVALACVLMGTLAFAAASAPAAKRVTVTASKSVAKGCHTTFLGKTRHSKVVGALSSADAAAPPSRGRSTPDDG